MKFDARTFTSKVSRRAFVLFVACALLPISILAFVSLRQVTAELRNQSERRLRQASKAVGLLLHKRLLELQVAIERDVPVPSLSSEDGLIQPFKAVAAERPEGERQVVFGRMDDFPHLTPEQTRTLAAGETLLWGDFAHSGAPRLFLSRALDPSHPEAGIRHGEINPDYLWVVEDEASLESGTHLIVIDEGGRPLIMRSGFPKVPAQVRAQARLGPAGKFTWKEGSNEYLASYWALFLANAFHTPNWIIVLSRENQDVLAPIAAFNRNFILVALLSLLLVLLLSFGQIRRILQPLDRLQAATKRLASGRLDARVDVSSRDEFEDLANSFNRMASQLGRQFDALTMRNEITVALSRSDPLNATLQSCVEILARHLDLSLAGVWTPKTGQPTLDRQVAAGSAQGGELGFAQIAIGQGEIGKVAMDSRPLFLSLTKGEARWSNPAWAEQNGIVSFAGHPVVTEGRLQAVVAIYASRPLDVLDLGSVASVVGDIEHGIARRRVDDALQSSEGQVRQLQKMEAVGRLAGGIAHDFNNLLTVIMGYSQMLLEGLDPEDPQHEFTKVIDKTAVRAAELTKQLLAFSRKQVLAPKLLDLNSIVSGLIVMLQRLIGESIELRFLPVKSPNTVKVDRGQIEQVVVNLVVNARDAMPKGGKIALETSIIDLDESVATLPSGLKNGPHVVLKVKDTGTGMDEVTLARIFEPFFTTKEPGKGTGLGLATVYGIVAQSGGSIQVESVPNVGTTFVLYFPAASGSAEVVEAINLPVAGGNETVLLVEDEYDIRTLIEKVLRGHGYTVLSAGRPSDALRISEDHQGVIHALLTDMVMPEMSGIALSQQLSKTRPELITLHMSGYTEYSGSEAEAAGVSPVCIQKPFTPDALAREIRARLDLTVARRWKLDETSTLGLLPEAR